MIFFLLYIFFFVYYSYWH